MTTLTIAQTRSGLADALNRVSYGGERIAIARRGKPIAAIVSNDDLETLQRIEDAEDIRDGRKALREYRRNPKSAMPFEDYVRQREAKNAS
jgi:prevent-host-death family protein